MLFATDNLKNKKIKAAPNTSGFCPECEQDLVAKCGNIYIWHWAHKPQQNKCKYSQGETEWHLAWKEYFLSIGADVEVSFGERRADVVHNKKVIEIQKSSIDNREIIARELFYRSKGYETHWIVDASQFLNNFICYQIDPSVTWEMPFGRWKGLSLLDVASDRSYVFWILRQEWFKDKFADFLKPLINAYYIVSELGDYALDLIFELDEQNKPRDDMTYIFKWKWARTCWYQPLEEKRVTLDFGKDTGLFHVLKYNLSNSIGYGQTLEAHPLYDHHYHQARNLQMRETCC